jgi:hypothetical protein
MSRFLQFRLKTTVPKQDHARWRHHKRVILRAGLMSVILAASISVGGRDDVGPSGPAPESMVSGTTETDGRRTILDLQPFRETSSIRILSHTGRQGLATLVNLQPAINMWYLLTVSWADGTQVSYHLENPRPKRRRVLLDTAHPSGLVIAEGVDRYPCELFGNGASNNLEVARDSQLPFYSICEARLYVRHPVTGHRTALETATEFFRTEVWGGELLIDFGHHLVGDLNRETGRLQRAQPTLPAAGEKEAVGPRPGLVDPAYADRLITPPNLGIGMTGRPNAVGMTPGAWYAADGNPGIYVSILRPNLIAPQILRSHPSVVRPLDPLETSALCYLVAFDLDQFEVGWARGTAHPGVGWSGHIRSDMRIASLPGPDGIGTSAPLVATGQIDPEAARRTVATFAGGFKRAQGAFKFGALALQNHGSHYGFIENGIVFSRLEPGLATIIVFNDGRLQMKTWRDNDNPQLRKVKYARQNGVALVDVDVSSRTPAPGPLVGQWGPGNWSGSEDLKLRTIRAGVALQTVGVRSFLIYAVFSDATPSAMARVFQAYGCEYAMLLDMNALEHTYAAVYARVDSHLIVQHLIAGMSHADPSSVGQLVPRFMGYPDNRDFFYVMKRTSAGAP